MEVIVPDEFLSVAIGKGGQNVRLASKLTRWRLDVKSEAQYSEDMEDAYNSLMALPGMTISLADALYERGFFSAEELSKSSVEDLTQVRDITEEKALELIEIAKKYMEDPDGEILHLTSEITQEQTSPDKSVRGNSEAEEDLSDSPGDPETTEEEALPDDSTNTETDEDTLSKNSTDTEMPEYASANDPIDNNDLVESDGSSVPDVQKQVENDNENNTL